MPLPQKQHYTIADIYALPDDTRAELIDGQIYYMAPPTRTHQKISMSLSRIIANYIHTSNGHCEVYAAPFAVYLNADENYLEPDISVICDSDKLDDKGCHGAPDWIIEIISPSTASHDYLKKLNLYKDAGVREYWIVDPREGDIFVYYFGSDNFKLKPYTFTDKIKVNIYDDLYLDFNEINL
jgi:Uma2 family endonuclease